MSSAAVTFYAAAVLPGVPPSVSATDLASGLFLPPDFAVHFAGLGSSGELALHIILLHSTGSASAVASQVLPDLLMLHCYVDMFLVLYCLDKLLLVLKCWIVVSMQVLSLLSSVQVVLVGILDM